MPQLTEAEAEKLSTEQATELVHVLELQARWENHRDGPEGSIASPTDLHYRQNAFDAFQSGWRGYAAKYRNARLPEPTQKMPDRLAVWCRSLRAVFRRAECDCPLHVMAKVYRLVDRVAAKMEKQPVGRDTLEDLLGAVRELDVVIAWCGMIGVPHQVRGQLPKHQKDDVA